MKILKKIESKTAIIFIENEILNSIYKEGADVKREDLEVNLIIREKLQKGRKLLAFIDVSKVWQFSNEARKLSAERRVEDLTIAMAILTGNSMPIILVANFFMSFNKPKSYTKLFRSKEKALEWLEAFKEKNN